MAKKLSNEDLKNVSGGYSDGCTAHISGSCVHCGKCQEQCPVGCIDHEAGVVYSNCVGCGFCASVCPMGAISIY